VPDAGLALALFALTVVTGSRGSPQGVGPTGPAAGRLRVARRCWLRRRQPEAAFVAAAVLAESYLAASGSEAACWCWPHR
jgi:hypothetical protein